MCIVILLICQEKMYNDSEGILQLPFRQLQYAFRSQCLTSRKRAPAAVRSECSQPESDTDQTLARPHGLRVDAGNVQPSSRDQTHLIYGRSMAAVRSGFSTA